MSWHPDSSRRKSSAGRNFIRQHYFREINSDTIEFGDLTRLTGGKCVLLLVHSYSTPHDKESVSKCQAELDGTTFLGTRFLAGRSIGPSVQLSELLILVR